MICHIHESSCLCFMRHVCTPGCSLRRIRPPPWEDGAPPPSPFLASTARKQEKRRRETKRSNVFSFIVRALVPRGLQTHGIDTYLRPVPRYRPRMSFEMSRNILPNPRERDRPWIRLTQGRSCLLLLLPSRSYIDFHRSVPSLPSVRMAIGYRDLCRFPFPDPGWE